MEPLIYSIRYPLCVKVALLVHVRHRIIRKDNIPYQMIALEIEIHTSNLITGAMSLHQNRLTSGLSAHETNVTVVGKWRFTERN